MTRRDYVKLAAAFRATEPDALAEHDGWAAALAGVVEVLAADNQRFDRTRFLTAAHREGEVS